MGPGDHLGFLSSSILLMKRAKALARSRSRAFLNRRLPCGHSRVARRRGVHPRSPSPASPPLPTPLSVPLGHPLSRFGLHLRCGPLCDFGGPLGALPEGGGGGSVAVGRGSGVPTGGARALGSGVTLVFPPPCPWVDRLGVLGLLRRSTCLGVMAGGALRVPPTLSYRSPLVRFATSGFRGWFPTTLETLGWWAAAASAWPTGGRIGGRPSVPGER